MNGICEGKLHFYIEIMEWFREATLVSSVAELVHDVIPQQASTTTGKEQERVEWISFQATDLNGKLHSCELVDRSVYHINRFQMHDGRDA